MSNIVILAGNLGADPELRHSGAGKPILSLRVATTERWEQGGEQRERTDWHTVVLFGGKAEELARSLTKGARVFVEGSLRTRSWEQDGQKKFATEVVAQTVIGAAREPGERTEQRRQTSTAGQGGARSPDRSGGYRPAAPPTQGAPDDDIPF